LAGESALLTNRQKSRKKRVTGGEKGERADGQGGRDKRSGGEKKRRKRERERERERERKEQKSRLQLQAGGPHGIGIGTDTGTASHDY
jgi:hypothetical protein